MNAKLQELFDRVQNVGCPDRNTQELGNILCQLIEEVQGIHNDLEKVKGTARRAANDASCLANGIQPD